VVVTATFRVFYVFVVLEVGTRRILHWNVTEHPTAEWTTQQFRMIVPCDQFHRFGTNQSRVVPGEILHKVRHNETRRRCHERSGAKPTKGTVSKPAKNTRQRHAREVGHGSVNSTLSCSLTNCT